MSRMSKSERVTLWLGRFNRFSKTHQTVAEFCRSENVSQAAFYQWKRKLAPNVGSNRKPPAKGVSKNFTELAVAMPIPNAARIRLAHGVVIELGDQPTLAATVVEQVLERCLPQNADSNEAASC